MRERSHWNSFLTWDGKLYSYPLKVCYKGSKVYQVTWAVIPSVVP